MHSTKTVNENYIDGLTDSHINETGFVLSGTPNETLTEANFVIPGAKTGTTISAANYSFGGSASDATKDHTIDLTIARGSSSKTITYSLNFQTAAVDSIAETREKEFANIVLNGSTNETTINLPSALGTKNLAAEGLQLNYSTDNGNTWHHVNSDSSFAIPTSHSLAKNGGHTQPLLLKFIAAQGDFAIVSERQEKNVRVLGNDDALNSFVDTSNIDLTNVEFTGRTVELAVSGVPTLPTGVRVLVSLNDGQQIPSALEDKLNITSADNKAWYTINEIERIFGNTGTGSGSANILDTITGDFLSQFATFKLEAESGYVFDDDRSATKHFSTMSNLVRVYDVLQWQAQVASAISVDVDASTHDALSWTVASTTLISKVDATGIRLEFSTMDSPDVNTAAHWSATLPTEIDFTHANRKLWVIYRGDSNNVPASTSAVNLISGQDTTNLLDVKAKVFNDTLTLGNIEFSGNTSSFTIDSKDSTIGFSTNNIEQRSSFVIEYRATGDNTLDSNWLDESAFETWLSSNPRAHRNSIEARVVSSDDTKFVIDNASATESVTVTNLFSYNDISAQVAAIDNITYQGRLNFDDGFVYGLPTELHSANLDALNVKLQYTLDGTTWIDSSTSVVSPNPTENIKSSVTGERITLTPNAQGNVTLKFRILPKANDEGADQTPTGNNNQYQQWVNVTWLHNSDFVAQNLNVDNVVYDKSADALAAVPTYVKLDSAALTSISLSGNTKDLTLTETPDGAGSANSYLSTQNPGQPSYSNEIVVAYSVVDASGRTAWLEAADFTALLAGTLASSGIQAFNDSTGDQEAYTGATSINWNSVDMSSFQARWFSKDRTSYIPYDEAASSVDVSALAKYVDVANLLSSHAPAIKVSTGSKSNALSWDVLTTTENQAAALGVEFVYSTEATPDEGNPAHWSTSLPTTTEVNHQSRHLSVMVVSNGNTNNNDHVVSPHSIVDVATTSGLRDDAILGYVDVSPLVLSTIEFTGDPINANIYETPAGISGLDTFDQRTLEIRYQVGNTGTTWQTEADFINWLSNVGNANSVIEDIYARVLTTNSGKFELSSNMEAKVDITNFFAWVQTDSEYTELNGITLTGQVGPTDGVIANISSSLSESTLEAKGLKLQFTTNGTTWNDSKFVSGDNPLTVAAPASGSNPILRFRIVPFKAQDGSEPTITSPNDFESYVNATRVRTSTFITNNLDLDSIIVDKDSVVASLPALVEVDADHITGIALNDNSKSATISIDLNGSTTTRDYLSAQNPNQQDYSSTIKLGYSVVDTSKSNAVEYWFEADDFVAWLHGDFETTYSSVTVWNTSGDQIKLPQDWATPNYNTLDMTSFQARWLSTDKDKFVASSSEAKALDVSSFARYVEVDGIISQLRNAARVTSGTSVALTWSDISSVNTAASELGVKFQYSNEKTPSTWTDTLPTTTEVDHNARYIWAKVVVDGTTNVINNEDNQDITSDVNIRRDDILGHVITSGIDVSKILFTEDATQAVIDSSPAGLSNLDTFDQSVVHFEFRLNSTSSWESVDTFKATMAANPSLTIADIEARIYSNDSSKYEVSAEGVANVDVSQFRAYINIDTEQSEISNITFVGTIGQTDGVTFTLPTALRHSALTGRGLALQYIIKDAPTSTWEYVTSADDQTVTIPNPPRGEEPKIEFRIVPMKTQSGTNAAPADNQSFDSHVDATHVVTSIYVAQGYDENLINVNRNATLDSLAREVALSETVLADVEITGNSRFANLTETIDGGKTIDAYLSSVNAGQDNYFSIYCPNIFNSWYKW